MPVWKEVRLNLLWSEQDIDLRHISQGLRLKTWDWERLKNYGKREERRQQLKPSISQQPDLIERRLRYAKAHIPEYEYRKAFKQSRFIPEKNLLVSRDGRFALLWKEEPEQVVGRQNIGSVQFLMLEEVRKELEND